MGSNSQPTRTVSGSWAAGGGAGCLQSCVYVLSRVQLFGTPWTIARQAPLSMGFPRQEYWTGLPFPPPGDLPDPGIEPVSLCLLHRQADSLSAPPGSF